jgi:ribonuclease P protein component
MFVFMASHRSPTSRFGFTVSKKVGGAVVRNRVRRRLKEIVRTHRHAFPVRQCFVIVARPEAATAEFDSLKVELLELAEQAQRKIPRGNS